MNNIIKQFREKFGSIKKHDENIPFFAKDITKDIESFILDALKRQREEICDRLEENKEDWSAQQDRNYPSSFTAGINHGFNKAIEIIKSE